ncbi:MAG: chemotaxis protein CheD [Oscillospiraceae bacterium]
MANIKNVGIADMKICRAPDSLITYALGSCVGVIIYDPVIKLAGMVHVMLPDAMSNPPDNIYKYANTGIEETIKKMQVFGAVRSRLVAKIAGGAKMFEVSGDSILGTIGKRNIERTIEILRKNQISILGNETGGTCARTLIFDAERGVAALRIAGHGEKVF